MTQMCTCYYCISLCSENWSVHIQVQTLQRQISKQRQETMHILFPFWVHIHYLVCAEKATVIQHLQKNQKLNKLEDPTAATETASFSTLSQVWLSKMSNYHQEGTKTEVTADHITNVCCICNGCQPLKGSYGSGPN